MSFLPSSPQILLVVVSILILIPMNVYVNSLRKVDATVSMESINPILLVKMGSPLIVYAQLQKVLVALVPYVSTNLFHLCVKIMSLKFFVNVKNVFLPQIKCVHPLLLLQTCNFFNKAHVIRPDCKSIRTPSNARPHFSYFFFFYQQKKNMIVSNQIWKPFSTWMTCLNTVHAECPRGLSLPQCTQLCHEHPDCHFGYFVDSSPSVCVPLRAPFYQDQQVFESTVPSTAFSVNQPIYSFHSFSPSSVQSSVLFFKTPGELFFQNMSSYHPIQFSTINFTITAFRKHVPNPSFCYLQNPLTNELLAWHQQSNSFLWKPFLLYEKSIPQEEIHIHDNLYNILFMIQQDGSGHSISIKKPFSLFLIQNTYRRKTPVSLNSQGEWVFDSSFENQWRWQYSHSPSSWNPQQYIQTRQDYLTQFFPLQTLSPSPSFSFIFLLFLFYFFISFHLFYKK